MICGMLRHCSKIEDTLSPLISPSTMKEAEHLKGLFRFQRQQTFLLRKRQHPKYQVTQRLQTLREAPTTERCESGLGCSSPCHWHRMTQQSLLYWRCQVSCGIHEELKIQIYNVDPQSSGARPCQKNMSLGLSVKNRDHEMGSVLLSDHMERKTQPQFIMRWKWHLQDQDKVNCTTRYP